MEKIFQVPYWVRPLQGPVAAGFMAKLAQGYGVQPAVAPADDGETGSRAVVAVPELIEDRGKQDAGGGKQTEKTDGGGANGGTSGGDDKSADPGSAAALARFEKLELIDADLAALKALAPTVGDSPRRIKRFFNTYLLIQTITTVTTDPQVDGIDPEARAAVEAMLAKCSFAQQTLALATSLALAMQDDDCPLDAAKLAALDPKQLDQPTMSFGTGLDPVKVSPEVRAVLKAYLDARQDDPAFPEGLAAAFGLFLPIACRYGFRDAG
jgi:hypothetical protein